MANIHTFTENVKVDVAMGIATLNTGNNAVIPFSMKNYDLAVFLVLTGTIVAGAVGTLTVQERIGATGGAQALVVGAIADTQSDTVTVLQARGEDMSVNIGFTHLQILIQEGGGSNLPVGAVLLRMRARYKQATLPA